jgi:S-adenosylmethionine:tRNA ribosyltransferase-isomerase
MPKESFRSLLKHYDYKLPKLLVALRPSRPRDAARLLVYNPKSKKAVFDRFINFPKYLPKRPVVVFNQTKVWPARLTVIKPSGGKAEILYIGREKGLVKVLSSKKLPISKKIVIATGNRSLYDFETVKKTGSFYFLKPSFPFSELSEVFEKFGKTPLPPYLKDSPLSEKQRRIEYQSIFAKTGFAVAAPTASLHFSKRLAALMLKQGADIKFVQLNVGLGTFATLKEDNLISGKLFGEYYRIDKITASFLNKAKKQGRPIIAVGTTVVRTLESAAKRGLLTQLSGDTDLFIRESYRFKFVDGLVTNFHVPKSSLMMLVAAFTGRKVLLKLYRSAIKRNFRFYSFGDGMLILPK